MSRLFYDAVSPPMPAQDYEVMIEAEGDLITLPYNDVEIDVCDGALVIFASGREYIRAIYGPGTWKRVVGPDDDQ